jgi:branched-chain amino acid transport system permease protein
MSAIVYSSLLAMLCIGYTLTYIISKIPNFAHGTYAGIGVYIAYTITNTLGLNPYLSCPFGFIIGGIVGVIIYSLVVKTLKNMGGGAVVLTISTLAIQIVMNALINIYATFLRMRSGNWAYMFFLKMHDFKLFGYQGIIYVSTILCISIVILLHFFLNNTKMGVAMRCTAEDPNLAEILGINSDRIQLMAWFITGGIATLAGTLFPLWFESSPTTGDRLINACMAGSLLGGINNIYGAIIGAFILGMAEILGTTWLMYTFGTGVGEYRYIIPLVAVIIVLFVQPEGVPWLLNKIKTRIKGSEE